MDHAILRGQIVDTGYTEIVDLVRMWIVVLMVVDLVESWVLSKLGSQHGSGSCETGSGLIDWV